MEGVDNVMISFNKTVLCWFVGAFAMVSFAAYGDDTAQSFELDDQYGDLQRVQFPSERVTVLLIADRAGSKQLDDWVVSLGERYEDRIDIFGVAALGEVPRLLRPVVRASFRRNMPDPVMLDWSDEVTERYSYESGLTNVIVIAPSGAITHRVHGSASTNRLQTLFEEIDALLDNASPRAG